MTGLPALREQLAAKIAASYGHHFMMRARRSPSPPAPAKPCSAPSPPWFTPATRVIMFEPAFDSYRPMIQLQEPPLW